MGQWGLLKRGKWDKDKWGKWEKGQKEKRANAKSKTHV